MAINAPQLDIQGPRGPAGPVKANPTVEYMVSGPWGAFASNGGLLIAQVYDDVVRQFGPRIYDLMGIDPAIASAVWMLVAGALADGIQISPAMEHEPGKADGVPRRKARNVRLAAKIYESCQRQMERMSDTIDATLTEACMAGLKQGSSLAETVFELTEDGDDRGNLVPTVFQVKPRWAYAFRVNPFLKVERIRCWTTDGWVDVERDHFALFSWMPENNDPRGTSLLRPCYTPWNTKLQVYPDYGKFLKTFGSPSLILEAAPGAMDKQVKDPDTGRITYLTPQQELVNAGTLFQNCSILGLPPGAKAHVLQPTGSGEAFDKGLDRFDRELFRTVILSTRPLQEAKHGSKADSESGLDIFGMAVAQVRKPLIAMFRRDFLRRYVALNWGPEIAARFTPKVAFGAADHVSPDLLTAFSNAWDKGIFEVQQRPFIWTKVGVPTPPDWTPETDSQGVAQAQAQEAAEAATEAVRNPPAAPAAGRTPGQGQDAEESTDAEDDQAEAEGTDPKPKPDAQPASKRKRGKPAAKSAA